MEVVLSQMLRAPSSSFPSTAHRPRNFPSIYDAPPELLPLELFYGAGAGGLPNPFLMPTDLTIIRPALLTDDEARGAYRILQSGKVRSNDESGLYSISFEDVGELVATLASGLPNTLQLQGHQFLVGY